MWWGMEQAKKRNHKIMITDIAVNKISKSKVEAFSLVQNELIDEIHKELLTKAKNENNSNEVACLFDLNGDERFFQFGNEHSVNVTMNPNAFSLLNSSKEKTLFLAHNHPSTQSFSYSDIGVFLLNNSIVAMSVVSNTGDVHILYKSTFYSYSKAVEKLFKIKSEFGEYSAETDLMIVKKFLKNSERIGIICY